MNTIEKYNERYENDLYLAATEGRSIAYCYALVDAALALCGDPHSAEMEICCGDADAMAFLEKFGDLGRIAQSMNEPSRGPCTRQKGKKKMIDRIEKYKFNWTTEWNDRSEDSPSHFGQLPSLAVLPSGKKVEITPTAIEIEKWNDNAQCDNAQCWVKMTHTVSARIQHWGEGGGVRGRCGSFLEVLAPPGTSFLFPQACAGCSTALGHLAEDELKNGRAPEAMCPVCEQELEEQKAMAAEAAARAADAAWAAERA